MNYRQTLDFLFSQLPMYQRVGAAAYKSDLKNTLELCKLIGNPQDKFQTIHIAGTNGKGSVAHMLASILQESGYKTGLYTSPHLVDFRERIRVNGQVIPEKDVISFVNENFSVSERIKPSFFEYTFAMAMEYFYLQKVDVAVIETGMGGRLDSTNIINPLLSIITNIGYDHTRFLGDTLESIATEKAGIIKLNVPVLIGETQSEIADIFKATAIERKTSVSFADDEYSIGNVRSFGNEFPGMLFNLYKKQQIWLKNMMLPFSASYQLKNAKTALAACELLNKMDFILGKEAILSGMKNVLVNTGFKGRWQVLGENPLVICDTGHNKSGLLMVINQIARLNYDKLHFVFGTVDDKELDGILKLLPDSADYYFCKANIPRGLDQEVLMNRARGLGITGQAYSSVNEAYKAALENADENDLVFIGGSTFVVAEVL